MSVPLGAGQQRPDGGWRRPRGSGDQMPTRIVNSGYLQTSQHRYSWYSECSHPPHCTQGTRRYTLMDPRTSGEEMSRAGNKGTRRFHNHGTRDFHWLKAPNSTMLNMCLKKVGRRKIGTPSNPHFQLWMRLCVLHQTAGLGWAGWA